MTRAPKTRDPDAQLVRAASRRVGIWITIAVSVLVLAVLVATLLVVFSQIPPSQLFRPGRHETTVDIEGVDIVIGAILVGVGAIALAGTIALLVTRRAVAPLVDALRRQRRFVADASHELRTPLAILDARLQVLQRATNADDPNAELIAQLRGDSHALGAVVTDLLDSIDATAGETPVPVQVDGSVQAAVTAMRMLARDRSVDIAATPTPTDVAVAIPEASLHRTLVALLDNAIKHSPPSVVTVTTSATRTTVTITVSDQGPGIRGIDPQRVFDRFARSSDAVDGGGTARTGFGIGLALVHDTITRYGGTATVSNTSPAGTSITLTLPRSKR
ncbi:sensor histidine kinase [Microbacterium pygmaeum]|uniref:histidine kinase n=1 Tax=Microbacterium pygmaeum TaxID=370764 RepID=A0A1G8ANL1_9MICO|nr:HAMP domain-containing sensor histidine kinase [Microbacterium pygmaeum]SDH22326.1 Signal transduction histidine kinase [Microbacterium pygmaeum]